MRHRSMYRTLLAGVMVFCLSACTTAESSGNDRNMKETSTVGGVADSENTKVPSPAPSTTAAPTITPVPTEEIVPTQTPVPERTVPVRTEIQVEAGTDIGIPDFFASEEDIPKEEGLFCVQRELSEEELKKAGAVYEVPVVYDGCELTVIIEVTDMTPPVMEGVKDITVFAGETISYKKGITLTDNADGKISFTVENDEVDLNTPGAYPVRYTATDASGNSATAEITVFVEQRSDKEAAADKMADALIEELITDDMSKWDTCYTLWNWCRTKITYSYSAGDRSSVYAGAYEGLHDRSGDCYVYYATFTVLLQKCGIETMEVRRVGGTSNHWWNLVNLGDGWYHCDSSPRRKGDKYQCFMQTDAQVQAYTESYPEHPNYYVFDESLYPERETKIVYGE
ncbi:MAG: transglutaminase domain-containing protein [Lachnospiraceae bacterium]